MAINYPIWKLWMKYLVCCFGYEHAFLDDSSKPKKLFDKDWEKLNRKAFGKIRKWIDNDVHQYIANESNAYKVWNTLHELSEKENA